MILQAFLVSLVAMYGRLEQGWMGQQMIARPIWLCPLVGLLLGDFQQGVIIGGSLELIWAGVVQVGATPTEVVTGSTVACGLAIINGLSVAEAITIAIPVGLLATLIGEVNNTVTITLWSPMANRAAEVADTKKIWWLGIAGCATQALMYGIAVFLAVSAGSAAVNAVIESIPQVVRDGLSNASAILPAVGIGILMQYSFDIKFVGFFLLGFLLPTYLEFGSVAVALAGVGAALIYFFLKPNEVEDD
ncbi:MAG: PTS sugar transporter subunit IIC [Erysipelotrichaceae bacterium]|nr:PTS sugar transporter subunit IIC [Erysipelotrichaceae bacterium]MCI9312564.1 PTS sugar transporter subunit IIC [Erysipelotrichaceae bacterium]